MNTIHFPSATRRVVKLSRHIAYLLRTEGPNAVVQRIYKRITRSVSPDPFDARYGVDTSGEISLFQLDISSRNGFLGYRYQASPPEACEGIFSSLPITHKEFTFIDVGAGKGRVLLIAARYSFKRLIGVEFASELVKTARANVAHVGFNIEVLHADAADYEYPWDNLVVYLYNPFGPTLLRPMLKSLQRISAAHEVYIVYVNPVHDLCIQEFATDAYMIGGAKVYRVRANIA